MTSARTAGRKTVLKTDAPAAADTAPDSTGGTAATPEKKNAKKPAKPVAASKAKSAKPATKPATKRSTSDAPAGDAPKAGAGTAPKQKLIRDSFTMPKADFALIDALKARAIGFQRPTRKSELLRAGLHALMALPDTALNDALSALTPLKAGRPPKVKPR